MAGLFMATVLFGSVMLAPQAEAFPAYGDGTSLKPYRIATCAQLGQISGSLKYYVIIRNIDCSGTTFTTIPSFNGSLDGQNHIISHLNPTGAGLFGSISGATIKNLTIANGSITGTVGVGSLAGTAGGLLSTIQNVHSAMTITGTSRCGGLIGSANNNYLISQSSFTGDITCVTQVGGLLGAVGGGTISDSFTSGTITVNPGGGIVGAGGLYGYTSSINTHIARSYSTMSINDADPNSISDWYGGLVGRLPNGGTIDNSFGVPSGDAGAFGFGGISGFGTGTITNSYYDPSGLVADAGCDIGGSICTAVNTDGSEPDYFKGNSSAPPLDTWNFSNVWEQKANAYPALRSAALAPTSYGDYNDDGTDDVYQAFITTVEDRDSLPVTISLPSNSTCTVDDSQWLDVENFTHDTGYQGLKDSMTKFNVYCPTSGMTVPVSLTYDKLYDTTNAVLRHYDDVAGTYTTVADATFGSVTINGIAHTTVTYNLTDGGPLDTDGTANGLIADPVGMSVVANIPGNNTSGGGTSGGGAAGSSNVPANAVSVSKANADKITSRSEPLANTGTSPIMICVAAVMLTFTALVLRFVPGAKR